MNFNGEIDWLSDVSEDGDRFKTLDEAKEYLIVDFNEYVARNLDEVCD